MIIDGKYGTYHGDCVDGTRRDGGMGWDGMGSETNSIDDDRIGWDNSIMNAYNRTVVINKEKLHSNATP